MKKIRLSKRAKLVIHESGRGFLAKEHFGKVDQILLSKYEIKQLKKGLNERGESDG